MKEIFVRAEIKCTREWDILVRKVSVTSIDLSKFFQTDDYISLNTPLTWSLYNLSEDHRFILHLNCDKISPARHNLFFPSSCYSLEENNEYVPPPIFPFPLCGLPFFHSILLFLATLSLGGCSCLFSWYSTKSVPKKIQENLDGLTVLTLPFSSRATGNEKKKKKWRRQKEKSFVVFWEREIGKQRGPRQDLLPK